MLTITLKVGQGTKFASREPAVGESIEHHSYAELDHSKLSGSLNRRKAAREAMAPKEMNVESSQVNDDVADVDVNARPEAAEPRNEPRDLREVKELKDAVVAEQAAPVETETETRPDESIVAGEFKAKIVWQNVFVFLLLHSAMVYGCYLALFHALWKTWIFAFVIGQFAGLGVTAGAHRLWSHRSYKARLPLRIVLMLFNCLACQNDLYEWTRDHRVHHKYSETNADPHNVNRGFFFAHVGWLMCKKHPEVFRKGKAVDCSDLLRDPVIRFQRKWYVPLTTFMCFYLPTVLPYLLFGETYWNAFFVSTMTRYVFSLNFTWLVNSAAHLWGNKPYDRNISPVENAFVSLVAIGEGFHNYHHTFPWDYRTSELGWKINLTSIFIEAMAAIGQAYDLKTVPSHIVHKRMHRTGDGTKNCFDSAENRTRSHEHNAEHHHAHPEEIPYEEIFGHRD